MAKVRLLPTLKYKSIKFGIKLGLATGAAYYVADQGVWKNSDKAVEVTNKIKTEVKPYTSKLAEQVPYELPSLPSSKQTSYFMAHYWNKGVKATFNFLIDIPEYITHYSKEGYKMLTESEQYKNLFNDTSTEGKTEKHQ